jgi:glutamate-5-semialdehyde dehydrogenase
LVATADRDAVGHFLALDRYIDVAIPRGGESLIRRVAAEAKMPVIKHFTGNCHVYVDASADLEMAETLTINAKCQRMGVCNACESLLVHRQVAEALCPHRHGVAAAGSRCAATATCAAIAGAKPATEEITTPNTWAP